jgi:hypothetical protein
MPWNLIAVPDSKPQSPRMRPSRTSPPKPKEPPRPPKSGPTTETTILSILSARCLGKNRLFCDEQSERAPPVLYRVLMKIEYGRIVWCHCFELSPYPHVNYLSVKTNMRRQ